MLDASEEWRRVQEQEVLNVGRLSTHFATRIITDAQARSFFILGLEILRFMESGFRLKCFGAASSPCNDCRQKLCTEEGKPAQWHCLQRKA